ncbi:MAG: response regulator transcription factor [Acidobacteria bacterium]|nr:response regulator transcription factor [Acidobacteriota bacterium]
MTPHLLLVEDEEAIALPLRDRLVRNGYTVEVASDGITALDRASSEAFQLILLDIQIPGKSGLDVCRDLRQRGIQTPILMLTAFGETTDKVLGLKLGADDYLAKPFDNAELLARIEALLRRATPTPSTILTFGPIRIDLRAAIVQLNNEPVSLSAKEFQLLAYFATRPGMMITREELLQEVWGYAPGMSTRTVDVHIGWLRQKLEQDPKNPTLFVTRIGLGYQFLPPVKTV